MNYSVDIEKGLLMPSRFISSPHYNDRPVGIAIDLLVIHNISLPPGVFGSSDIEDFFLGRLIVNKHPYFQQITDLRVSSHLLIRRDGEVIQFVPFHQRAWHAGQSSFKGRQNCNDFSIGIELEGTDHVSFEEIQYQRLAEVTEALMASYPDIKRENIVGHSDIAAGRKTDPGPCFDWEKYELLLR